ncbi:MAG: hypothetical protein H6Q23_639 [Bacteroidetes bacterium]|nr:hypothetical protein [Bacteroidota bacterium]
MNLFTQNPIQRSAALMTKVFTFVSKSLLCVSNRFIMGCGGPKQMTTSGIRWGIHRIRG